MQKQNFKGFDATKAFMGEDKWLPNPHSKITRQLYWDTADRMRKIANIVDITLDYEPECHRERRGAAIVLKCAPLKPEASKIAKLCHSLGDTFVGYRIPEESIQPGIGDMLVELAEKAKKELRATPQNNILLKGWRNMRGWL